MGGFNGITCDGRGLSQAAGIEAVFGRVSSLGLKVVCAVQGGRALTWGGCGWGRPGPGGEGPWLEGDLGLGEGSIG